jgi:hypothetical protein
MQTSEVGINLVSATMNETDVDTSDISSLMYIKLLVESLLFVLTTFVDIQIDVQTDLSSSNSACHVYGFQMNFSVNKDISSNSISQIIFIMENGCVLFAEFTYFLNIT